GGKLTFGRPAEMGCNHDGRPTLKRQANGRHRGTDARVLGDVAALVLRNVEIGTNEDALALQGALFCQRCESMYRHLCCSAYLALTKATVVSSMRLEKPHSLSYQLETFTRLPDTLVSVASYVLEAALWLKSTDTSGAVLYARMPFSAPSEASLRTALT